MSNDQGQAMDPPRALSDPNKSMAKAESRGQARQVPRAKQGNANKFQALI